MLSVAFGRTSSQIRVKNKKKKDDFFGSFAYGFFRSMSIATTAMPMITTTMTAMTPIMIVLWVPAMLSGVPVGAAVGAAFMALKLVVLDDGQ